MIYTESNVITLDKELQGQIVIKNEGSSCIFKVKANMGGAIETKPTHGFFGKQGETIVSVRYIGNVTEIDKVKLKIYYLPVESGEIPAGNIAQTYKKLEQDQRQSNEKFLTFTFVLNQVQPENVMKEFRYTPVVKSDKKTQRERLSQSKHISQFNPIKEEARQILITTIEPPRTSIPLPLINIILVAFLLGITFGIKITRLKLDYLLLS